MGRCIVSKLEDADLQNKAIFVIANIKQYMYLTVGLAGVNE